jgi:hypothetical protein
MNNNVASICNNVIKPVWNHGVKPGTVLVWNYIGKPILKTASSFVWNLGPVKLIRNIAGKIFVCLFTSRAVRDYCVRDWVKLQSFS